MAGVPDPNKQLGHHHSGVDVRQSPLGVLDATVSKTWKLRMLPGQPHIYVILVVLDLKPRQASAGRVRGVVSGTAKAEVVVAIC